MPKSTPWGMSDYAEHAAPGITFYGTPSHGGFHLSADVNAKMPDYLLEPSGWYEEDCAAAKVIVGNPQAFTAEKLQSATDTLRNWYPEAYEKHFGVELKPGESYMRDENVFHQLNAHNYLVLSAFGEWHEACPKGYVIVLAGRGGRQANGSYPDDVKWFQVPATEYSAYRFVVDPQRHQEVKAIR